MLEYFDLLGYKVKDKVTGFNGVATSWCIDLYGCICISVNPGLDDSKKLGEQCWFDAKRLEKISKTRVMDLPKIFVGEGKERGAESKPRMNKP